MNASLIGKSAATNEDSTPPPVPAADSSPRPQEESRTPAVLVVDDEPLIRWSLGETLQGLGFRVLEAGDAASALAHFAPEADPVDLVFLDLRLPDSDDLGVLGAIKEANPACAVILMTAYSEAGLAARARAQGASEVVDKPFDLQRMSRLALEALPPA